MVVAKMEVNVKASLMWSTQQCVYYRMLVGAIESEPMARAAHADAAATGADRRCFCW